jgi:rare lipoprotein A
MKKITSILFIFIIYFTANSQTIQHEKETGFKENIKKIIARKDSIKASKIIVDNDAFVDTIVVPKGKYKPFKTNAHASYYADKFSGRKSASGVIFYNNKYMAAHKKLPFGTKLKVTNPANNKTVYVDVVDRGPFVKGRELDLSSRAFREIASNKGAGAVIVTIEILQK